MSFRERLYAFMQGRYGTDTLSFALLALYIALAILNSFLEITIIVLLQYALVFYIFFRILSRNHSARYKENQDFLKIFGKPINAIKRKASELKDSTKVYKTCPKCKSRLRLARRRGRHTVRCPRCQNEFKIFTLYS